MEIYAEIAEAVKSGKKPVTTKLVQQAIDNGCPAGEILNEGLVVAMNEIGEQFKNNEIYVPEVLIAARAMKAGMALIKPLLVSENVAAQGKVVIATVKGDLHDIGKNLVAMMLEGAGFEVIDLGIDADAEKFLTAAKENDADIIAMSALLTTTMPSMAETVEAVKVAGLEKRIKVMIGGAPVTQEFADQIGADGYSSDAASAVDLARELMTKVVK